MRDDDLLKDLSIVDGFLRQGENDQGGGGSPLLFLLLLFPFAVIAALGASYPLLLRWQYRRGDKIGLILSLVFLVFAWWVGLPYARGNFVLSFVLIEGLAGLLVVSVYLMIAMCRRLHIAIAKRSARPIPAKTWLSVMPIAFAVGLVLSEARFPGAFIVDALHGWLSFFLTLPHPNHYYAESVRRAIAAPFTVAVMAVVVTVLHAWFSRQVSRPSSHQPLYVKVVSGAITLISWIIIVLTVAFFALLNL